jgi:hypothetical protein
MFVELASKYPALGAAIARGALTPTFSYEAHAMGFGLLSGGPNTQPVFDDTSGGVPVASDTALGLTLDTDFLEKSGLLPRGGGWVGPP